MLYYLQLILHFIYRKNKWSIPNDLQNNKLKGKVKSLTSKTTVTSRNYQDTSWANDILRENNFEKFFNPFGFLVQEITMNEKTKIESISSYEYGDSVGFCKNEIINFYPNKEITTNVYKYLFSKNKITKWQLTSTSNLPNIEYLFDSKNNLKTINKYRDYIVARILGEKKITESTNFNSENQISNIIKHYSMAQYSSNYFYKQEQIDKIEVNTEYNLNYRILFSYDNSNNIKTITWVREEECLRKDSLINDKYGNWVKKDIEISNGWIIKIERTIDYYKKKSIE